MTTAQTIFFGFGVWVCALLVFGLTWVLTEELIRYARRHHR